MWNRLNMVGQVILAFAFTLLLSTLFVPVRVLDRAREDGQNPPEVAALQARYGVNGFPMLIVVSAGNQPQVLDGYPGQAKTIAWLQSAAARARVGALPGAMTRPGAGDSIH